MSDDNERDPITWPGVAVLAMLCATVVACVWLVAR